MKIDRQISALGIQQAHLDACRMPRVKDATNLVDAGQDIFERPLQMTAATFDAWQGMQEAAERDGIILRVVSAYRSVDYQCQLISKKLDRGIPIEEILKVNAIPGYSEHHTGRALDLTTPEFEPLDESFENSPAFVWLMQQASAFGFTLSYPRDNAAGIDYEPWHWAHST